MWECVRGVTAAALPPKQHSDTERRVYERLTENTAALQAFQSDVQCEKAKSNSRTPWIGCQFIALADIRRKTTVHTHRQLRDNNQPNLHVSGLWEEAGAPRGNLRQGENIQVTSTTSKGPRGNESHDLLVLTTVPHMTGSTKYPKVPFLCGACYIF